MNPEDFNIEKIRIGEARTGQSLVVEHKGHAVLFQIENASFSYKPDTGTIWTLESEPLEDGEPLRIEGDGNTWVHRITKKRG